MNILVADDNRFALAVLTDDLKAIKPNDTVVAFSLPRAALEYVNGDCTALDVAFLDVEMPVMSGIELAVRIKQRFPRVIIIFVSAYPQYAVDAFKIHANGYLVKPASREMLEGELAALSEPFLLEQTSRVRVTTFGNFELYIDEKPVKFANSKSKELLAYLIDRRGSLCSMGELVAVLFGDEGNEKSQKSYIRNLISDIRSVLSKLKAENIINKEVNGIAINPDEIDCDYYRMLNGEPAAINQFFGEYMTNYSWAEITLGGLNTMTY